MRILQLFFSTLISCIRFLAPIVLLGGSILAFVELSGKRQAPARGEEQELPPLVTTATIQPHSGPLNIEVDGVVVPFREIRLAAEVSGRIERKPSEARAGNYVTQGTVLLEIDESDYELAVRRLSKQLLQSEQQIEELEVERRNTQALLELAEQDLGLQLQDQARIDKLSRSGIVSDSEIDGAKRKVLAARNSLVTLQNQLQLLSARRSRLEWARDVTSVDLEQAKLDRRRTTITAPNDGVIISDFVEQDAYVARGESLFTIEDISAVEVSCNLEMQDLYWLWNQQTCDPKEVFEAAKSRDRLYEIPQTPVTVMYEMAGDEFLWKGELSRYDGLGVDEKTRTVPSRVIVEEPLEQFPQSARPRDAGPPALVRGMYVTVQIHADPQMRLLRLPEQALRPGNRIWKVEDGRLAILPVNIARIQNGEALVNAAASGLSPRDKVIVSPLAAVDGMEIREQPVK